MIKAIVFTGSRDYKDEHTFNRVATMLEQIEGWTPYVGCAKGLDKMVRERWKDTHVEFKASWTSLGPSAGPERNNRMLTSALDTFGDRRTVLVVAFPGGPGTANCVKRARDLGLTVFRVES